MYFFFRPKTSLLLGLAKFRAWLAVQTRLGVTRFFLDVLGVETMEGWAGGLNLFFGNGR